MKRIADIECPMRASFRFATETDIKSGVGVNISDMGAAIIPYYTRNRIGAIRELIARSIYRDIEARPGNNEPSREEMARTWAEALVIEGQGSQRLLRALAEVLRECAAEGDEWAEEILQAFAPSPEAVAA